MIIRWPYLIGLIPLLLLIIPNRRSTRICIALLSAAVLVYIWSGMAKAQQVDNEFVGRTLQNMATLIDQGQPDKACVALTLYTKAHTAFQFDGFKFHIFMQNQLNPKNSNPSEQLSGP